MASLLSSIQNQLIAIGGTLAVIAIIVLGVRLLFAGEGGIRKAISGGGTVLCGIILIGGGAAIAGAIMKMAKSLG